MRGRFLTLMIWLAMLPAIAWGAAALWFDIPAGRGMAGGLAAAYVLASIAVLVLARTRRRGTLAGLLLFALVLGWWLSLAPRNDRNWQPDVARLPSAEIQGERIRVHNLRNFAYRSETDFTPRWETREYDLTRLRGLDLHLVYWGSPSIAHTILSWEFEDGAHLAISIETRKEVGEAYSAVRGFFRQYELYYVIADERDVIGVRTHHRREDVYLYRLRMPAERARALLLDYLQTVNALTRAPRWYNALTHNCTTSIRLHANNTLGGIPRDWRWLANGYIDEYLYEQGVINRGLPMSTLKLRSYLNPVARAQAIDDRFSARIRANLPARPR
jgi:hypothetical protein